jgi:hypothetical protein
MSIQRITRLFGACSCKRGIPAQETSLLSERASELSRSLSDGISEQSQYYRSVTIFV